MEELEILLEGSHEWSYKKRIEGDLEIHTLYYASNPVWDERLHGREAMVLIDDGDGYKIEVKREEGKYKEDFLDYSEMAALKYLMEIVVKAPKATYYKKVDLQKSTI